MKKLICSVMAIIMAVSLCIPAVAADETTLGEMLEAQNAYGLSTEAVDFLEAHDVDLSIFDAAPACYSNDQEIPLSMDSAVLSLIQQTEAYGFTDEQIQQYVDGLVYSDPIVVPRDGSSPYAVTNAPNSTYRSDGPGFEVRSKSGFNEATAFATLPTAYNVVTAGEGRSNGWMFYTVSGSSNWGIDVGLAYSHGSGGNGWRGCYTPLGEDTVCGSLISGLKAGSRVYFHASIEPSGYLRFRILDANDFSIPYYDISYYVGDHGIYRTNGSFNRQITMTTNRQGDNTNGSYMRNASFSDAYLYTASGSYSKTNTTNTQASYRGLLQFGTKQLATVNSYTPWYAENISISFS